MLLLILQGSITMTNQTSRVLELLKRFNNGQKVCIASLQNEPMWEGKSEKTIRRDLDVIKEYFPESFELIRGGRGEKGCYKAITQSAFDNFLKPDLLSLMIQTFNIAQRSDLFDNFDIEPSDKKIIAKKIKEVNNLYEFKNKPFERAKDDFILFKKLESSIQHQSYIILEYPSKDGFLKLEVKPYKIVFMHENFYLACEVEHEEFGFSIFRISKIKSIEDTKKTFHKNFEIEDFIKDMQTPFAIYKKNYKQHLLEVVIEVDKQKAYFFRAKDYLKSQKIIETKENGNILISYKVTQVLEVDELIKKWLPYVRVISPVSLKESIEDALREYLQY